MELGFMELMRTAAVLCDVSLKAKPGEKIVIVADSRNHEYQGQEPMIEALMAVMAERGLDPTMICYEGRYLSSPNVPEIAEFAMANADIVVAENSVLILQSQAMQTLWKTQKTRGFLLPSGINITWSPDEIYRMMPRTEEELLESSELMYRIGDKLKGNPKLHFTAENGTDITLELAPSPMFTDDGISLSDGICDKPGELETMPPGNLVAMSKDGTVNGRLVLDAEASVYSGLLPDAVTITYENGLITSIEGNGTAANLVREFLAEFDPEGETNAMPEYGMGFNPRAKLNGNSSEGECLFGCIHVGVGYMDKDHFDAIIPNATLEINGELVLKDGQFL